MMLIDPPSSFDPLFRWEQFERDIREPAKTDPDAAAAHRDALEMIASLKAENLTGQLMAAGTNFAAQVSAFVASTKQRTTVVFHEASERTTEFKQSPVGAGGPMPIDTEFLRASLVVSKDCPVPTSRANPNASGTFAYADATVSLAIAGTELQKPSTRLTGRFTAS